MSQRRKMEVGDWMNAAISAVIGVLLGSFVYGLVQLVASGSWLTVAILLILAAGLLLIISIDVFTDKLFERFLPARFRPAKSPKPQLPKPLPRVLSLPVGFIVGILLAVLGLDGTILDFLP